MTALTKNELHQLISGATNGFEEVDICGTKVMVRGVTTREYFIHIVRRFPSVRSMLTMSGASEAQFRREAQKARAEADQLGEPFDLDAFRRSFVPDADETAVVNGQIDSGLEEKAAFIACGLDHPGDRDAEAIVLKMREAMFDGLLEAIERLSFGGDQGSFFDRVMKNAIGPTAQGVVSIGSQAARLSSL